LTREGEAMSIMQEAKVVIVTPADRMSTEIFVRHMNLRHADSLGGMTGLPEDITPAVEQLYRSFHARLHSLRLRSELRHEHGRP
jgi:hypothetical protein